MAGNLGSAVFDLRLDDSAYERGWADAERRAERGRREIDRETGLVGKAFGGLGKIMEGAFLGVGFAAAHAGLDGLRRGLGGTIGAAVDFQSTMSGVKAVSGATAEQFDNLSKLALRLGKDTSFSASESAAAIEELVKGGVRIEDILNGAADATLSLAAAGGTTLPEAATIAANALAQFGLKGQDMAHVADLIAGAANASALDVNQFKFSLQAAGAVASTVGFTFDDLAQGIAVMGKAGIVGSDAGTSLKTMMLNLQPSTKAAAGEMRQLGLFTIDETNAVERLTSAIQSSGKPGLDALAKAQKDGVVSGEELFKIADKLGVAGADTAKDFNSWAQATGLASNAFFDANGQVKSMAEVAELLQVATEDLTDAQRLQALETIFGSDAIRAAAVLAREGGEGFAQMAEDMGKVTAASVAATRLDNVRGSLEQLKGSLETAGITIGQYLLPGLRDLIDWATRTVNAAIPLLEAWGPRLAAGLATGGQAVVRFAADLRDTLGEALGVARAFGAAFLATFTGLRSGDLSGAFAPILNAVQAAFGPDAVALVGGFVSQALLALHRFRAEVLALWRAVQADAQAVFAAIAAVVRGFLSGDLSGAFAPILAAIQEVFGPAAIRPAIGFVSEVIGTLQTLRGAALPVLREVGGAIAGNIGSALETVTGALGRFAAWFLTDGLPAIGVALDRFLAIAGRVAGFVIDHWRQIALGVGVALAAFQGLSVVAGVVAGVVAATNPLTLIIAGLAAAVGTLAVAWTSNWGNIRGIVAQVAGVVEAFVDGVREHFGTIARVVAVAGAGFVAFQAAAAIAPVITSVVTAVQGLSAAFSVVAFALGSGGGVTASLGLIVSLLGGPVTLAIAGVTAAVALFTAAWVNDWGGIRQIVADIADVVRRGLGAAFDAIMPLVMRLFDTFRESLPRLRDLWSQLLGAVEPLGPILRVVGGILATVWAVNVGILLGALGGLVGFIEGAWSGALTMVSGLIMAVGGVIQTLVGIVTGVVKIIANVIRGDWSAAWDAAKEMVDQVAGGITQIVAGLVIAIVGAITGLVGGVIGLISGFVSTIVNFFKGLYNELVGNSVVPDMVAAILAAFVGMIANILAAVGRWVTDMTDKAVELAREVGAKILNLRTEAETTIRGMVDVLLAKADELTGGWVLRFRDKAGEILGHILAPFRGARDAIGGIMRGFRDLLLGPLQGALDKVGAFVRGVKDAINWISNRLDLGDVIRGEWGVPNITAGGGDEGGGGGDFLQGYATGLKRSPGVWGWVGEGHGGSGAELAYLARGSRVIPHDQSMALARSGAAPPPRGGLPGFQTGLNWPTIPLGAATPEGRENIEEVINVYLPFGQTRNQTYDVWGGIHPGLDIYIPSWAPIYAAAEGRVIEREEQGYGPTGLRDAGGLLRLSHEAFDTVYAHLRELYVGVGEAVARGQLIGRGSVDPLNHLHFETRRPGSPYGPTGAFDPAPLLGLEFDADLDVWRGPGDLWDQDIVLRGMADLERLTAARPSLFGRLGAAIGNTAAHVGDVARTFTDRIRDLGADMLGVPLDFARRWLGRGGDLVGRLLDAAGVGGLDLPGALGEIGRGIVGRVREWMATRVQALLRSVIPATTPGLGLASILGGRAVEIMQEFGPTPFSEAGGWDYSYAQAFGHYGHTGLDLGLPYGSQLFSPASGVVSIAGGSGYFTNYGAPVANAPGVGELRLRLDSGHELILGHMSQIFPGLGQRVNAGELVGLSGDLEAPHVHVEYRIPDNGTPSGWRIVDPRDFLRTEAVGGAFDGGGAVDDWLRAAIDRTGVSADWLEGLRIIAHYESGGDPNAINLDDINAQMGNPSMGLMQVIRDHFLPGEDPYNPVDNATAAIRYILRRYGDVRNTPGVASILAGGGYRPYARGGALNERVIGFGQRSGALYDLAEYGREFVLNDEQMAGVGALAAAAGAGGGDTINVYPRYAVLDEERMMRTLARERLRRRGHGHARH